jgi:hypothetical protein
MGFVMSPMSTAAMNAVTETKAGVASGILSMSRMVGGTFGVAALGALFQHLSSQRLADSLSGTGVTAAQREHLVQNLGSGAGGDTVRGLDPATAEQVGRAVKDSFIHALSSGMWLATGLALTGALAAWLLVSDVRATSPAAATPPRRQPSPPTPSPSTAGSR